MNDNKIFYSFFDGLLKKTPPERDPEIIIGENDEISQTTENFKR